MEADVGIADVGAIPSASAAVLRVNEQIFPSPVAIAIDDVGREAALAAKLDQPRPAAAFAAPAACAAATFALLAATLPGSFAAGLYLTPTEGVEQAAKGHAKRPPARDKAGDLAGNRIETMLVHGETHTLAKGISSSSPSLVGTATLRNGRFLPFPEASCAKHHLA